MAKPPAFIVPHRVHCGSGFGRPPSGARQQIRPTVWQSKPGTVSERPRGKAVKSPSARVCAGLDCGQRLVDHLLKKNKCTLMHALMNSFRRHCHRRHHRRHCFAWRQRRVGVTPGPTGDAGEKECAGQLRHARLTKPVRRAVAAMASEAKPSVNMAAARRVQAGMDVSLAWC